MPLCDNEFCRNIVSILKWDVWSTPIRTEPAWWTTTLTPSHFGRRPVLCGEPVMGQCDDDEVSTENSIYPETAYFVKASPTFLIKLAL
ncbi:jg16496 [Pararge aegeria aegeria]|uniref:Jg16496 protein n=1 Tax=Pararge aegeria aegeria TaxID=348720 RepID=A0A8S4QM14_9NEOP|nr:jg16496 [Pararge aegeria aegeria]